MNYKKKNRIEHIILCRMHTYRCIKNNNKTGTVRRDFYTSMGKYRGPFEIECGGVEIENDPARVREKKERVVCRQHWWAFDLVTAKWKATLEIGGVGLDNKYTRESARCFYSLRRELQKKNKNGFICSSWFLKDDFSWIQADFFLSTFHNIFQSTRKESLYTVEKLWERDELDLFMPANWRRHQLSDN